MEIFENGQWLPLVFALLLAVAVLMYAILDGYDIGVGILSRFAGAKDKDTMIASIGPFWDANETWLVLAVGLLLIAFPKANGIILTNLYLPTLLMLVGLILRGVSFDFRAKAEEQHKEAWNTAFAGGSFLMAMAQGYMLGSYILGFEHDIVSAVFCLMVGFFVAFAYSLIGASWLIMKTEGDLQQKAVHWASRALRGTALGIILVSLASPMVSEYVYDRWFNYPYVLMVLPVPLLTIFLVWRMDRILGAELASAPDRGCWRPFAMTIGLFLLCLIGLCYSFYPYIVPGQLKIVDAASAPESLMIILVGALIVLPILIGYTFYAYKVFHGKTQALSYD